jgi:hypothetical protein
MSKNVIRLGIAAAMLAFAIVLTAMTWRTTRNFEYFVCSDGQVRRIGEWEFYRDSDGADPNQRT